MKFILASILTFTALAQQSPVAITPPPAAPQVTAGTVGVTGNSTYYYLVVANYPGGSVQSAIFTLNFANATLTGGNYNQISWGALPNALTYDVLRLSTNAFNGTCTCSVTTGITATQYSDQGGSLSSYTVTAGASGSTATMYVDNARYAGPKLRVTLTSGTGTLDHLAEIASGTGVPAYGVTGDLFVRTGATNPGVYFGSAPNVFTYVGVHQAQNCGSTATCAATNISGALKIATGTGTLVTGTPSTFALTGISPAFTSATSYTCVAQDTTTIANNIGVLTAGYVSGSAVTFTGPNTNTDGFKYTCIGN